MIRRPFGKTGMEVSVLGFGGAEIGFMHADQSQVNVLLNTAIDAGLNTVDTAECYVDSETKIGKAISHRRKDFYLFTKVGHRFEGGPDLPDWSPELLEASVNHSLRALNTDYVDLLQIHSCSKERLEEGSIVEFMQKMKSEGKCRFIGYSGDSAAAAFAVQLDVFDSLQTSLNIADQQSIDLLLPLATDRQMGIIAKRPIANVAWHNGSEPPDRPYGQVYWERLNQLKYPFLEGEMQEAVEIAMRFTLSQSVSTMIVGTTQPHRWQGNAKLVSKGPLPKELHDEIRSIWRDVSQPDWAGQS